VLAAVRGCF